MHKDEDDGSFISPVRISLVANRPILATSPNYVLSNKCTANLKQLIIFNRKFQQFANSCDIADNIIATLWCEKDEKFYLLTEDQIFTYDPSLLLLETVSSIQKEKGEYWKSFALERSQSILFIAYNQWGSKYIDTWKEDPNDGSWKNAGKYLIDLTDNECIEMILVFNEDDVFKIAMTIYNAYFGEWRLEIRDENSSCLKKIKLPGSDSELDYRMVLIGNNKLDMEWLIYSPKNKGMVTIDKNDGITERNYRFPISEMAQFEKKNLIIRTKRLICGYSYERSFSDL